MAGKGAVSQDLPDISVLSAGAVSLLALAAGAFGDGTKQRRRDILDGTVLRRLFQLASALPGICARARDGFDAELLALLGRHPEPKTLFDLFVAFHDTVWQAVAEQVKSHPGGNDRMTGFDHSAFLAHFQAFMILLEASDGVGPPYAEAVRAIADIDPAEIQWELTANYFGNIMQDYFEAAAIRRTNPGLPSDVEERLREEDGAAVADIVFGLAPGGQGPLDWPTFNGASKRLLAAVAFAEQDQYAARHR